MSRQELIGILVGFIRDPALCVWPHRVKSAELLSKICGWTEPERIHAVNDPLQVLIDSIRARVEIGPMFPALPVRPLMNGENHPTDGEAD
jgi:hypothetical protein